jgi:hypothetical protein
LRGGDGTGATTSLAPDETDDARIVATWLAGHDAATLDLARAPGAPAIERFVARTRELSEARREMNAARRAAARPANAEADARAANGQATNADAANAQAANAEAA